MDSRLAAYLDTTAFPGGIEYDDANGAVKLHLYDLLIGDCNIDGVVNVGDFCALRTGFGTDDANWFTGDLTFDGRVDSLDYISLKPVLERGEDAFFDQVCDAILFT